MRRAIGRKNAQPKSMQMRELQTIVTKTKRQIESQKKQIILNSQKINMLIIDMKKVLETIDRWSQEMEPTEEELQAKFEEETKKKAIWRNKETKAYTAWKESK